MRSDWPDHICTVYHVLKIEKSAQHVEKSPSSTFSCSFKQIQQQATGRNLYILFKVKVKLVKLGGGCPRTMEEMCRLIAAGSFTALDLGPPNPPAQST